MTAVAPGGIAKKKLIEVALPLDAINEASVYEKKPGIGAHPRGLHQWWARRPLSAARAVIFAQIVDDPSANPDLFPTEKEQERERQRLFRIIEDLVKWENTTNDAVLERARAEIWQSWRRACAENADHPRAKELFDRHVLPAFHDPFAGGGALPLEAQRLGLEAHASDLNPVAVLINKAMIEIPPKFAGRPPVNPQAQGEQRLMRQTWRGAQGLAEDVRYYGRWMRDEAEKRIGHLYPKVRVSKEMARDRPDLAPYIGRDLTVVAWLWARTVRSPNPAFADLDVPLVSNFVLSKKKGSEAYVEPLVEDHAYRFNVKVGTPPESAKRGTKSSGSGSSFICLMSGSPITFEYVRSEAQAGRMSSRLLAVVAEGDRCRLYFKPTCEQAMAASSVVPTGTPDTALPERALGFRVQQYGMTKWRDLFTNRQLIALTTLCNLVTEARERVILGARSAYWSDDDVPLQDGGNGATAYADAIGLYLAFGVDRCADFSNSCTRWVSSNEKAMSLYSRQTISMTWDHPEAGILNDVVGGIVRSIDYISKCICTLSHGSNGRSYLQNAMANNLSAEKIVSTDPPYYDNIAYADLSDFFYVWLRRSLRSMFPDFLATLTVPKSDELVATPFRHGTKEKAESFFLNGMTRAMHSLAGQTHPGFPVTIYYAFKQSERRNRGGVVSTGWETFLEAVLDAGFAVSGTWPMRTEQGNRLRGMESNALASSIVLVCRPRSNKAPTATRREFQESLNTEFPQALAALQRSNIAPVDLAQASIGPGMAIFTRFQKVLNADGSTMSVADALALINATLDEVLAEQEGDSDADSRWALDWFDQHGFTEGEYGVAETLCKAKNTSVDGLVRAGFVESTRGTVRLLKPVEFDPEWDPASDRRLTVWEMTHHLIRALAVSELEAADLAAALGSKAETARDLAYRLYTISERKRRAADALQYNSLVQSWPEIARLAEAQPKPRQASLLGETGNRL